MKRPPISLIAAAVVMLAGLAGLARAAVPQAGGGAAVTAPPNPIVIGGAYLRQSPPGGGAAAYCTIYNVSDAPDTLQSVASGAGALAMVHLDPGAAGDLTIPAHGSLRLAPGVGQVVLGQLYGPLRAGQTVDLEFTFAKAGQVLVIAPVIGVTAPTPTGGPPK